MKRIFLTILAGLTLGIGPSIDLADGKGEDSFLLDVRTPKEYSEVHVVGATNIDFLDSSFKEKVSKLDRSHSYKVYCRSGSRAGRAIEVMKSMGFKNLENLGSVTDAAKALRKSCEPNAKC